MYTVACSAASNNVAHTGQEISACPGRAFELTLSCLASADISLRFELVCISERKLK